MGSRPGPGDAVWRALCGGTRQLLAYDTHKGQVTWYHDIDAETGGASLSGFSVTPEGTILGIVDQRDVYEWDFRGQQLLHVNFPNCAAGTGDGPCPHHDVVRAANGQIFAVTARPEAESSLAGSIYYESACVGSGSVFIDDGVQELTGGLLLANDTLMTDAGFDPSVDVGPVDGFGKPIHAAACTDVYYDEVFGSDDPWEASEDPLIDWTHVNAVAAGVAGQGVQLFLSVPKFNEIIRYDPVLDQVLWTLSGDPGRGDFTIDTAASIDFGGVYPAAQELRFSFQHHLTTPNGRLQFFDNRNKLGNDPSRVLRMELIPPGGGSPGTATITRAWTLPDDSLHQCGTRGSAQTVPGTSGGVVLAACANLQEVLELTDDTGGQTPPAYTLGIDQVQACGGGGPASVDGWYRAYPLANLGEFL